jgi:hypothetical protein
MTFPDCISGGIGGQSAFPIIKGITASINPLRMIVDFIPFFYVDPQRRLSFQVRDVSGNNNIALKLRRVGNEPPRRLHPNASQQELRLRGGFAHLPMIHFPLD